MILPIIKRWYDMILSGEKKEEYRNITKYYDVRFTNLFKNQDDAWIMFRNGYSQKSPSFYARCSLRKGYGKSEWGAESGKEYYILDIKEILKDDRS